MDEFKNYLTEYYEKYMTGEGFTTDTLHIASSFWIKGVEQGRHEYVSMDKHTRESIEENAIVGERKRLVELIKTAPDYNESYFCFHTLDKLVELIEEV